MQGTDRGDGAAICARELRKRYGRFDALRGVTLSVPRGKIHGLLGPNGAGKSTLIKLLVGVARRTAGQVEVLGLDPIAQRNDLRPRIGYMPQAPALYEDLSARNNVRFFAQAHGLTDLDRRVEETLEFVGLAERGSDPVYSLSGGMKQRVSLACALVHQPEVLFLDEPTAGVDPRLKETFWAHFREMATRGITLIISSHLMDEARLCDELTIMREGRVLITAPPADIMQRGRTRVLIWRGETCVEEVVHHYYTELPPVLRHYGLDPSVTRLELHEDSLETIMLRLVDGEER
jgi:ABC-2 type transport system ATP-binding protein